MGSKEFDRHYYTTQNNKWSLKRNHVFNFAWKINSQWSPAIFNTVYYCICGNLVVIIFPWFVGINMHSFNLWFFLPVFIPKFLSSENSIDNSLYNGFSIILIRQNHYIHAWLFEQIIWMNGPWHLLHVQTKHSLDEIDPFSKCVVSIQGIMGINYNSHYQYIMYNNLLNSSCHHFPNLYHFMACTTHHNNVIIHSNHNNNCGRCEHFPLLHR